MKEFTGDDVRRAATDKNGEERTWQETADRLNLWSADEIVDRAARKAESWRYIRRWCAAAAFVILVGITEPVHTWLHTHLQFLLGIVVGSWAELAMCERWPQRTVGWLRDRWQWMRWFSWQ